MEWCFSVVTHAGLEICRAECCRLRLVVYVAASRGLQVPTEYSGPDVFTESNVFILDGLGLTKKASAGSEEETGSCSVT